MNLSSTQKVSLLLLSGSLLGLAFPPYPLGILAWFGFVPLLFVLENVHTSSASLRRVISCLYITFFVYHGIVNWWISSWQSETDPYLLASGLTLWLFHPFFFMVPVLGYWLIRRKTTRNTALAAFPFLWTAFEWAHGLGEASYPWISIGYTQIYHTLYVQVADITGVWGISWLIVVANSLLAFILFKAILPEENDVLEQNNAYFSLDSVKAAFTIPTVLRASFALLIVITFPLIYGVIRVRQISEEITAHEAQSIQAGVVQPSFNPWKKWSESGDPLDQVVEQTRIQDSLRGTTSKLDLVVWNETAIPFRILLGGNITHYQTLKKNAIASKTALLTGFPDVVIYPDAKAAPPSARSVPNEPTVRWDTFNAAMIISSDSMDTKHIIHHKTKLTPFAERLPYADYLTFALTWFEWGVGISGWGKGNGATVLPLYSPDHREIARIAPVVCIESIYPDYVADFSRKGATILAIITNDAWYDGTSGPEQHFQIAAMRAIENRKYIIRSANSGISGIISPLGTAICKTKNKDKVGISASVIPLGSQSLYVQFGDWFAWVSFLLSVIFLLNSVRRPAFVIK